jgi:hypothetical protein
VRNLGIAKRKKGEPRFCPRDQRQDFRSRPWAASAFLTSDCEIPNCRAIAEGLTPALNAATTALSLPVVNEPAPSSPGAWLRCRLVLGASLSAAGLGTRRRRSASAVTAASRVSISVSSKRFSAPARSSGKKWRGSEVRLSGSASPSGRKRTRAPLLSP